MLVISDFEDVPARDGISLEWICAKKEVDRVPVETEEACRVADQVQAQAGEIGVCRGRTE